MAAATFQWPAEIEAAIYDLVRPHVRRRLKARQWRDVHAELKAKVPRRHGGEDHFYDAMSRILAHQKQQFDEQLHAHTVKVRILQDQVRLLQMKYASTLSCVERFQAVSSLHFGDAVAQ